MRAAVSLFAVALAMAAPVTGLADEPRNPAIESVIQKQLDAFVADDVETAFSFASPGIQGLFGSPQNFGNMVKSGYPMVWRPGSVSFGALRTVSGALWQTVIVTDQAGAIHALDYQMDADGSGWEIDGVMFQRAPQVGAYRAFHPRRTCNSTVSDARG